MVSCYAHQTHRGHRVQQARWLAIFGKDPPTPSGTEHWILGHQGLQPRALTEIYVWASRRGVPLVVWCVSPPATNRNACSFTIYKRICESGTFLIDKSVSRTKPKTNVRDSEDLWELVVRKGKYSILVWFDVDFLEVLNRRGKKDTKSFLFSNIKLTSNRTYSISIVCCYEPESYN